MKKIIEIYTDGSCLGNQNNGLQAGGWAALLILKENGAVKHQKLIKGCSKQTTNNQMELTALIKALKELKESAKKYEIKVYTDSQYLIGGLVKWRESWEYRNFKGVKNSDLWKELFELYDKFNIKIEHVKAHSGHKENEIVDKEARKQAKLCK